MHDVKSIIEKIYSVNPDVTIVCATKTVEPDIINTLPSYGLKIAGENRVQELLEKFDRVKGVEWHFIGQLQSNKVKYLIDKVSLIHSLDRHSLAKEIDRQSRLIGKISDVLVEVNMGEEDKGGIPLAYAETFVREVRDRYANICIKGLMAVMPLREPENNSELHLQIKALYDKLKRDRLPFEYLSVGMSNDYMTAIKYGANMVRLGRAIFGDRN